MGRCPSLPGLTHGLARRSAPWGIGLLLLAVAGAGPARGADEEAVPPPRGPPMTALVAGVLGRSDLVVVGQVLAVRGPRGPQTARVAVERVLLGTAPDELTFLVGGPRPTQDPRAPSRPYFEEGRADRYVLLLGRPQDGEAWQLQARFDADGLLGEEKIRVLEAHIRLARIPGDTQRAEETRTFLVGALKAETPWTRVHAARELNYLVGVRPEVFDAATREQIQDAARRTKLPALRPWLERLLRSLSCVPPPPDPEAVPPDEQRLQEALAAAPTEAEQAAVLLGALDTAGGRALVVVLRGMSLTPPPVRVAVLDRIAQGGGRAAASPIRGLYSHEEDADVQRAIVRAVGRLGGAGEVPWLEERTEAANVRREALFALARIRTPEALAALERARERFRRDPPADEDMTALVEYLLGPAFLEVERAEGGFAGPRRGR